MSHILTPSQQAAQTRTSGERSGLRLRTRYQRYAAAPSRWSANRGTRLRETWPQGLGEIHTVQERNVPRASSRESGTKMLLCVGGKCLDIAEESCAPEQEKAGKLVGMATALAVRAQE